ncbi:DUF2971 domain-containing protein [Treponema pedis]|uniref:DUF2971 domain-containing protein n=1 Tax=Treponema pedis TaxID=409322 RepID=UPI003D22892F
MDFSNPFTLTRQILEKEYKKGKDTYVYHYTTGAGLKGIIKSHELWLSQREYMNDVKEYEYAKEIITKILQKRFQNEKESILKKYDITFEKFSSQFIFSTSTEEDLISMWSYYSQSEDSYCIRFSRKKLIKYFGQLTGWDKYYYGSLFYKEEEIEKFIFDVFNKDMFTNIFESLEADISDDQFYQANIRTAIKYIFSLIKQFGHYSEKEYRFSIEEKDIEKIDFETKRGLLVPTLKLKLEKELPIDTIYIGPNCNENQFEIMKHSLEQLLESGNYKIDKIKIEKSKLAIR